MSTTVAFRFPLGRYHATPWDRNVNEGAVEWPPSPWRILRTLVATWYTRWPELPAPVLDGLLDALGDPPAYRTPPAAPGHTRHYLPDLNHIRGETGQTDLTLDPYLWVPRDAELLVRWDADLAEEQREVLAKLVELVPYLGRAESVCEARLVDADPLVDATWWRPSASGARTVRLLAPTRPVQRAVLELSTVEVRRRRRTVPMGTTWITYGCEPAPVVSKAARAEPIPSQVTAVRYAIVSRAPMASTQGVLLAEEVRRRVIRALDGGRREVVGYGRALTDHQHAHWLPLPAARDDGTLGSVLVWVPAGLTGEEVARIAATRMRHLPGRRGGDDGYEIKGFPEMDLLLQAAGPVGMVAPELCGPARQWRSLTPYLPVRHRKPMRETLDDYLANDVATELRYRGLPSATVARRHPEDGLPDRWALPFRRYRIRDRLSEGRPGLGLVLTFAEEVHGPLVLGQLSHFGFGLFTPDTSPDSAI